MIVTDRPRRSRPYTALIHRPSQISRPKYVSSIEAHDVSVYPACILFLRVPTVGMQTVTDYDVDYFNVPTLGLHAVTDYDVVYYSVPTLGLHSATDYDVCLLYTSPSPRDAHESRMPSSA